MRERGHVRTIPEMNYEDPSYVIVLTSLWIPHLLVLPIYSLLLTAAMSETSPQSKSKLIGPDITRDTMYTICGTLELKVNPSVILLSVHHDLEEPVG